MKKRSFGSFGFSSLCVVALTAAFATLAAGCCAKCVIVRCGSACKKPCCVKQAKCPPGCTKPCCAKKAPDTQGTAAAPVNANCPISGESINPTVTTVSAGKTVGFCCKNCVGRWEALTQAERDRKLAEAM